MKKNVVLIVIVAIVLVLAAGAAVAFMNKKKVNDTSSNTQSSSARFSPKIVDACVVLTPQIATAYFGEVPEKSDTPSSQTSSDDINVSNCSYSTKFVIGQAGKMRTAGLLARSAKTQVGADSNKSEFTDQRPQDAQSVSGYGNDAFWSPTYGQLNILKGNNWYIIQAGYTTLASRTLDDAKKLADQLQSQL